MSDATEFIDKSGRVRKRKTHCKHGHLFTEQSPWKVNWKGYKCRVCLECQRLWMRKARENPAKKQYDREKTAKWRAVDPERARAAWKRAYQKRDRWIQSFKTKCKFCAESRFPCLDFHHRDAKTKLGTIGLSRHWPREKLLAEIKKCDVVCANCHRWHHWEEKQKQHSEGD